MNTAKQWATDVCDILEPYVYAPNTPPNDRIMQLATRIFGANDIDTMFDVYRMSLPVGSLPYTVANYFFA